MRVWVMYDITDNKLRHKVAKACKQIGLKRMQKSVFYGKTRLSLLTRFRLAVKQAMNDQTDSLLILPITKKGMKKLLSAGKINTQKNRKDLQTEFL